MKDQSIKLLERIAKNTKRDYLDTTRKRKGYVCIKDEELPDGLFEEEVGTEIELTVKVKITSISENEYDGKKHKSVDMDIVDFIDYESSNEESEETEEED